MRGKTFLFLICTIHFILGTILPQKNSTILKSPAQVMRAFQEAINEVPKKGKEAYKKAIKLFNLEKEPEFEEAKTRILMLSGILSRLGKIDYSRHLRDEEYVKKNKLTSFLFFPRSPYHDWLPERVRYAGIIEFVKTKKEGWKFSKKTYDNIKTLYEAISSLPVKVGIDERKLSTSLWIRSKLPQFLKDKKILSLEYWQWLGILIIIFLGIALDRIVRFILGFITKRILSKQHTIVGVETLKRAVRPIGLAVSALFWVAMFPVIGLTGAALTVLKAAVRVFAVLAGTWAAWRIVDLVFEALAYKARQTVTKVDDVLVPLGRKTFKVFIVVFGIIYAAESLDIEIAPLIASLGIGGLAFAFAAKDTIENFFGSIAVLLDRPFSVGDWVIIGDVEGIVEEIGFRSTRVRTFYNSQVTIPNATLVRATVDNYGRRKYRRTKCYIGIQYDTPPDKILAFREGIQELIRKHPYTRKDYYQVWFNQFGPSSLDILLYVFFEVPDWSTELRERERLFIDIIRLANSLGIEFAFPTQTIHLYQEEAKKGPKPTIYFSEEKIKEEAVSKVTDLMKNKPWKGEKPPPVSFE